MTQNLSPLHSQPHIITGNINFIADQAIQISTSNKKSLPFASPLRSPSSETQIASIDTFSDKKRRKFAFGKHLNKSKQL